MIAGILGNETYIALSTYATEQPGQFASHTVSALSMDDISFQPDRSYEVGVDAMPYAVLSVAAWAQDTVQHVYCV